jgi:hypothetical protein
VLLGVPVLTYIFLVTFGRNHYDLPKLLPTGVSTEGDTTFYQLNKELLQGLQAPERQAAMIVWLHDDSTCANACADASWIRVQDQTADLQDIFLLRTSVLGGITIQTRELLLESASFIFKEQYFANGTTSTCNKLCLLDEKGIVRGLYNACSREELDRLFLEIKVLNYKE